MKKQVVICDHCQKEKPTQSVVFALGLESDAYEEANKYKEVDLCLDCMTFFFRVLVKGMKLNDQENLSNAIIRGKHD